MKRRWKSRGGTSLGTPEDCVDDEEDDGADDEEAQGEDRKGGQ